MATAMKIYTTCAHYDCTLRFPPMARQTTGTFSLEKPTAGLWLSEPPLPKVNAQTQWHADCVLGPYAPTRDTQPIPARFTARKRRHGNAAATCNGLRAAPLPDSRSTCSNKGRFEGPSSRVSGHRPWASPRTSGQRRPQEEGFSSKCGPPRAKVEQAGVLDCGPAYMRTFRN